MLSQSGRLMLISDIMGLFVAFLLGGLVAHTINSYWLEYRFGSLLSFYNLKQFVIFAGLAGIAILWLDLRGHYRQRLPFWETVGHILAVAFVGFIACGFIQFAAQGNFSRLWLGFSWLIFGINLFAGRGCVRLWLEKQGKWHIPAILIGEGASAEAAQHALEREPHMGFDIIRQAPADVIRTLTQPNDWKRWMAECGAGHIFLALDGGELEKVQASLKAMVRERVPCTIVPPWMDLPSGTLSPHHFLMHDVLLLHDTNRLYLPLPRFLKRSFDILVSSISLLLLAPLFLALTVMIRKDGGPAFFKQARVGRNGEKFLCYKFRSMRIDAEDYLEHFLAENPQAAAEWKEFQKLKEDVRITRIGDFIRRKSLDELPQLINVLKGDMSLVGPRPIMPGQEEYYGDDFVYYESVRPGISGPWQVSGRNQLTFKERVVLEVCYTRNWSLWLDIVILLKTPFAVLKKEQAF